MEDRIISRIHDDERPPVVARGRQHGLGLGWIKSCQGLPAQARFIDAPTSEYGRASEISLWVGEDRTQKIGLPDAPHQGLPRLLPVEGRVQVIDRHKQL